MPRNQIPTQMLGQGWGANSLPAVLPLVTAGRRRRIHSLTHSLISRHSGAAHGLSTVQGIRRSRPGQIHVLGRHRRVNTDTEHDKSALDGAGRCSVRPEIPPRGCIGTHRSRGPPGSIWPHRQPRYTPQLTPGSRTVAPWSYGVQPKGGSFPDPRWSQCSKLLTSTHPGDPSCWDLPQNIPPQEALAQVGFPIVPLPDCRVMWDTLPSRPGTNLRGGTVSPAPGREVLSKEVH